VNDGATTGAIAAPANLQAMGFMALAALGVALVTLLVRLAADDGLHPFVVAFFRNLVGLTFLLPIAWRAGDRSLRTDRLPLHALRGVLQTFAMLGWFYGLTLTSMATVAALGFTAPLFATLLAIVLLREQVGWRRWAGLVAGFAGTLVILRPGADVVSTGALFVVGSAFCWGAVMIVLRLLGRTETSLTSTVYAGFFLVPFTFVPALFVWRWPTPSELLLLLIVGVVASGVQLCVAEAFKRGEATAVLPVDFTKLVWGALLGFVVFAEVPDVATLAGGTLIFAAVVYVAYRERMTRERSGLDDVAAG
jgi:drug/metabolite transporter (DMT)-like permease